MKVDNAPIVMEITLPRRISEPVVDIVRRFMPVLVTAMQTAYSSGVQDGLLKAAEIMSKMQENDDQEECPSCEMGECEYHGSSLQ